MSADNVFSINIGGVTVTRVNSITGEADNQDNFNTCEHRSAEQLSKPRKTCCQVLIDKGYKCFSLNIFPLTPTNCIGCANFKKK